MDTIETLQAQIEQRNARILELANLDDITPELDTELDTLIAARQAGELEAKVAKLEQRAAAVKEIAERGHFTPGVAPAIIKKVDTYDFDLRSLSREGGVRDRSMRVLEDRNVTRWVPDAAVDAVEKLIDSADRNAKGTGEQFLATMRPEYIRGFAKLVTGSHNITAEEARALDEARAWSNGSDSAVIPELFDPQIQLFNAGAMNPFRQVGTIKTGTADIWEGIYTAGVTASWDAEATEVSDDDPAFTRPTITAAKGAAFVPFSVEFDGDGAAVVAELAMLFAEAKTRLESTAFATGTGSGQPKGVITALDATTWAEILPTTDGSFGVEDLYKLMNSLGPRYRQNASWVASMTIANRIRAFGTALGHAYTSDLTGSYDFAPLGRPLYESSDYPSPTSLTTGSQNLLTFGDHSQFYIYDRIGLAVEYIPHLFSTGNGRPTGSRGVYGWWRTGSDVMGAATASTSGLPILLLQNQ